MAARDQLDVTEPIYFPDKPGMNEPDPLLACDPTEYGNPHKDDVVSSERPHGRPNEQRAESIEEMVKSVAHELDCCTTLQH